MGQGSGGSIRMWKFRDYVRANSSVPMEDWYKTLLPDERAQCDITLDYMERIDDWDSVKRSAKKYGRLVRELVGLTEIKFDVPFHDNGKNVKKHFRPVGFMNREEHIFDFIGGFQKGHNNPIPEDAFERLLKYKREYEDGQGETRDRKT